MGILNNFATDVNFWKVNPQLIIPEVFNKLYKEDKSKDKADSSQIMWAIALIYDPESKFINIPLKDRKTLVLKDYLKNPKQELPQKAVELYEHLNITPAKRQLIEWSRIMDEKSEFLRTKKYNEATWDMIEKMLSSNTKLYSELERISDMLEREGGEGVVKGGTMESASEKGDL